MQIVIDKRYLQGASGQRLRDLCAEHVIFFIEALLFPCSSLLGPTWALFRWVQMHILFSLDYIGRYGFAILNARPRRLEHDIHDLQYALFGALCGALATRDEDVAWNFTLACPEGALVS